MVLAITAAEGGGSPCHAQSEPVNGIRSADLRTHAIVGATVVTAPGTSIEDASLIIRDGMIEAVGWDLAIPPEARVWSAEGLTVYPGLIDAAVLVELEGEAAGGAGAHWNERVHPEVEMADQPAPPAALRKALRELGFTAAAVYPADGIFRGSGAVVALADEDDHVLAYRPRAAMAVGFDRGGEGYPRSLMGAIALIRQTLYDARWHAAAQRVWSDNPHGHEPPIRADALVALWEVTEGRQPVLFDVIDEHYALRAARIARAFDLEALLLGSGYEFRRLEEIKATGLPIIVPLDFPDRPAVASLPEAERVTLRTMMTWEQAPTNVRRLIDADVTVALTTHRLEKRGDFPAALQRAIQHGLDEEEALAALTTTPARLLRLGHLLGTIEAGKVANLVVVEGSLFERKPKVRDTWINGRRYEISREPEIRFVGRGAFRTDAGVEIAVRLDTTKAKLTVDLPDGSKAKAKKVTFEHDRLSAVVDGRPFEVDGYVRLSGVVIEGTVVGTGVLPSGDEFGFTISPAAGGADE